MKSSRGRATRRLMALFVALTCALVLAAAPVAARSGGLAASPSYVNLGQLPAGTEGHVAITLTNNTTQTFTLFDVTFKTYNSFGLAQQECEGNTPLGPNQSCTMNVYMGPQTTGFATMRLRWSSGTAKSNWVTVVATGT